MSSQLQHRLLQFEVEPPAGMWDAISDDLDAQATPAAEKLRAFEVAPAPQLWQQIADRLDAIVDAPSKTIPFYQRYAKPLRYGSAVAVLLLVAVTITLLVNNNGDTNKIAQHPSTTRPTGKASQRAGQEATIRASEAPGQSQARKQRKEQEEKTDSRAITSTDDDAAVAITNPRPANGRYLTLATETGKPVRLSKKVYPVFDCAEHSSAFERFQCQENIESLQKMASSLASPSSDFASLMDMIKTLEENR